MKTWSTFKRQINESVIPKNTKYGFVGTAGDQASGLLSGAVDHVKTAAQGMKSGFNMSDETIGHYLDSVGGRHLANLMASKAPPDAIKRSISRSLGEFSKTYNPQLYESWVDTGEDLQENDPHMSSVYAKANSTEGRFAASSRRAADAKARAEYLRKKNGEPESEKKADLPKKTVTSSTPSHQATTGIYHANPAKRAEAHKALRQVLDKPLKAHEAGDKIKAHFDDDRVHSDIAHFAKSSPDIDVRPLVKKRMEQLRKQRGF